MTGMNFIGHVETSGVSYTARTDKRALEDMKKRAREHGQKVIEMIKELEK